MRDVRAVVSTYPLSVMAVSAVRTGWILASSALAFDAKLINPVVARTAVQSFGPVRLCVIFYFLCLFWFHFACCVVLLGVLARRVQFHVGRNLSVSKKRRGRAVTKHWDGRPVEPRPAAHKSVYGDLIC